MRAIPLFAPSNLGQLVLTCRWIDMLQNVSSILLF